jgi:hypothetical protein
MFKSIIKFIHDLRILFFALILISFLYTIGVNPVAMGRFIGAKIGSAVGISTSTSVPPNPFNTAASQLNDKEKKLAEREKLLNQKEAELNGGMAGQRNLAYFLSVGVAVLFTLIILNFYFDYKSKNRKN